MNAIPDPMIIISEGIILVISKLLLFIIFDFYCRLVLR